MQEALFTVAKLEALFGEVMRLADARGLVSKEPLSVDGTLIETRASQECFNSTEGNEYQRPGGPSRNSQADWKGRPSSNYTLESSIGPDARRGRGL